MEDASAGVGAAAVEEDEVVRRAFEILYEDYALFRPAGHLLIRRLANVASTANALYSSLDGTVSDAVLPRLRGLFDAIDQDGDGTLDFDDLLAAASIGWRSSSSLGRRRPTTAELLP